MSPGDDRLRRVVRRLRREAPAWGITALDGEKNRRSEPFRVLIATVLSQRTRDEDTAAATRSLFRRAKTPRRMLRLAEHDIARLIFPVGFHRTKARTIHRLSREILDQFGGEVPSDLEDLLSLPGVGRKTANLVLTHGFHTDGICVDTHVHRTLNRMGCVRTRHPEQTEMTLRRRLPREHWREINGLLVAFGQTICRPLSPLCSRCPVRPGCRRIGVRRSR